MVYWDVKQVETSLAHSARQGRNSQGIPPDSRGDHTVSLSCVQPYTEPVNIEKRSYYG